MRIRKYNGKDMQEALAKVRADLGVEAVILNSRKVKRRGVAAWFSKPYFEVLAAVDENYAPTERTRRPATVPARNMEWQEERPADMPAVSSRERTPAPDRMQEANPDRTGSAAPRGRQAGNIVPMRASGLERTERIQTEDAMLPRTPTARYGAAAYAGNSSTVPGRGSGREAPYDAGTPAETAGNRRERSSLERTPVPDRMQETGTELGALREQVESMAKLLERMQERIPDIRPFPGKAASQVNPVSQENPVSQVNPDSQVNPVFQNNPASQVNPDSREILASKAGRESAEAVAVAVEPVAEAIIPGKKETPDTDRVGRERLSGGTAKAEPKHLPDRFLDMQHRLQEQEVDDTLAERIMDKVRDMLPATAGEEEIRRQTGRVLTAALGEPEPIRLRTDGRPLVAAFIGPTGVGKTTTLAKIAADYALNRGKKVGLITADTYRIAAVEQLKTYAEILNLPVTVVYAPSDLKEAVAAHQDKDIILIDTAGRSHRNRQQFDELQQLMQAVKMDEVYLVLSGNTGRAACREILEHYTFVHDYKLLFTKLDETPVPGVIFNARLRTGRPISYITTGQSVPDDLEIADPKALAAGLAGIGALSGTSVNGRKAP